MNPSLIYLYFSLFNLNPYVPETPAVPRLPSLYIWCFSAWDRSNHSFGVLCPLRSSYKAKHQVLLRVFSPLCLLKHFINGSLPQFSQTLSILYLTFCPVITFLHYAKILGSRILCFNFFFLRCRY